MLGKSLAEVRAFPASEITLWLAYLKVKNETVEDKPASDIEGFKTIIHNKA